MKLKLSLALLTVLIVTSCATISTQKLFSKIEPSTDPSYGYTAENPVAIRNVDIGSSIGASYYFLSRLRTEKGNKFEVLGQVSVKNPNEKRPIVPLRNKYTGNYLKYGTGPTLDLYVLKAENESDTLAIYINNYAKDAIKIPKGLIFEKEEIKR